MGAEDALLQLAAAPSSKLRYLGPYKVATIAGLRVVVFDDLRAPKCDALIQEINSSDGDVDLLLTASWPTDVLTGTASVGGALLTSSNPDHNMTLQRWSGLGISYTEGGGEAK